MMKTFIKRLLQILRLAFHFKKQRHISDEQERFLARRVLAGLFADARGISMKLGQLMSSASDENSMQDLVTSIPAIPLSMMKPSLTHALKQPAEKIFRQIDESEAAASLGQVHHAVLQNGIDVAIKIRYPDIDKAVDAELRLLGFMPGIGPVKKWGFDLEAYKKMFQQNMRQELSYLQEAAFQHEYAQKVKIDGLIIPDIYEEFSTDNILVQAWQEGLYLHEILNWPEKDKKQVAEILLRSLFKSLFEAGLVHGDPHMGNRYFRKNDDGIEVVLMDFGCMIRLSQQQRLALLKLVLATRENQAFSAIRYFGTLGFDVAKLANINRQLPFVLTILFRPFLADGVFDTHLWDLEKTITALLGEKRWWFRSAGPADLMLIMRAFQGVVQQLEQLQVQLDWWDVLQNSVSADCLQQAREFEQPAIPEEQLNELHTVASVLRVHVTKNGDDFVNMSLPADAVLQLPSIIPAHVLEILSRQQKLDVHLIMQKIIDTGVQPQRIIDAENDEKHYSVWLE